jgi:hypothetical protein
MLSAAAGSWNHALPTELHGQTDLRLEIMKYIKKMKLIMKINEKK